LAEQCWNFICPQRNRRLSILEAFEDMRSKLKLPFAMEILILQLGASGLSEITRYSKIKMLRSVVGKQFILKS
jgi:hypothetical protein